MLYFNDSWGVKYNWNSPFSTNQHLPAVPFAGPRGGAHEVPTPRLDARLIRTKLCRVTPDHAHFSVRSSGKFAWIMQFSAKRSSGEGGWGVVD